MEAVGHQAVQCVVAGPSPQFHGAAACRSSPSSVPMDCCNLRSRLGLAGSSLQPRKTSRRNSTVSSPPSACLAFPSNRKFRPRLSPSNPKPGFDSSPASLLQEENLLSTIHTDNLEADAPALLAECADMDWKKLVDELHSEALQSVESLGRKTLCLKALKEEMRLWIHDRMVQDMEVPIEGGGDAGSEDFEWSYKSAAEELRMQANLQAAEQLARSVDVSFDWEAEVAELHRRVYQFGGAEAPEAMNSEQRLLHAWFLAQGEESLSSTRMVQEAISSSDVINPQEWEVLTRAKMQASTSSPKVEAVSSSEESGKDAFSLDKSWLGIGAALAGAGFWGVEGGSAVEAVGADPAVISEAVSRTPSWLPPTVLAFPVVSYFAFSYYREKVNPAAKITDWMFSVVALVIVANIVLMATIGVRLY
ncbi:hypothetical protein R1flu_002039 [Riccia fluitans]|uniref:Uncharacterized protein n=1 Tax=Riccia fluitans TaxID=41844 RepID=A0ABD1Y605_9MARC